jgi:hypothetical protein
MVAAALGHIPPIAGALLQEGIDVAVILNAPRAMRVGDGDDRGAASRARPLTRGQRRAAAACAAATRAIGTRKGEQLT